MGSRPVFHREKVDIIFSMIYPSHWGDGYFGAEKPDLDPYRVISGYAQVENEVLDALEDPPVLRPWLQDFTASYLGSGNYKPYGAAEVEAQVQELYDNGIEEFLLWNASNRYSRGVDYSKE
ncbi:putative glycoside hydrolase [Salinicoccus roseus]|uniref:putative glycoside hydrolase n=1 Tax=Salinicoccus roseus TaxID=45670 RepID=UPI003D2977A3